MCPPYPHACRKRRLKWVSRNNSKKVDPVSVLGRARLRTLPIVYGIGSPTVNFFFSPPVHLCAVTYITGILLHVSLKKPISFTAGIATPPTTMFQSCIPNAVLEPPSNLTRFILLVSFRVCPSITTHVEHFMALLVTLINRIIPNLIVDSHTRRQSF